MQLIDILIIGMFSSIFMQVVCAYFGSRGNELADKGIIFFFVSGAICAISMILFAPTLV